MECSPTTSARRRLSLLALAGALLTLALPAAADAATRSVSLSGTDNAGCATPCRHIAFAVTQAAIGDTVDVGPGTFSESQIVIDKPMTLQGAGVGQTTVDGSAAASPVTPGLILLNIPSVGDITIDGFKLQGGIRSNTDPEPFLIYAKQVPAGGTVAVTNNYLFENTTTDPTLASDYAIGMYSTASRAVFQITDNRFTGMFQGVFLEASTGPATIAGNDFNALLLSDCTSSCSPANGPRNPNGIFLLTGGGLATGRQTIEGNTFRNTKGVPMVFNASGSGQGFTDIDVIGNLIAGQGAPADAGGQPPTAVEAFAFNNAVISGVRVIGNDITMAGPDPSRSGVNMTEFSGGSVTGAVVQFNRIVGSNYVQGGVRSRTAATVDARWNWWGCNSGPNTAGCTSTNTTVGTIDSSPHLTLTANASPASVAENQSSTITASLTRDSAGNTPAGNVFPSGLPIALTTNLGALTPTSPATVGPVATSTFTSPDAGTANVTAALDNATAATSVVVNAKPAPAPPAGPAAGPAAAAPTAAPTISFVSPPDNGTLGLGTETTVAVNVTAPGGLGAVTLSFNGRPVCTRTAAPFTCQFTPRASDGGREGTFTAVVTDVEGRAASVSRAVTVGGPAVLGSHTGQVKDGVARIRIRCAAFGPCHGTLGLRSRIKGRRSPLSSIGSTPFDLEAGQTRTITVDISSRARRLLEKKGFLGTRTTVTTGDTGITRNLVLHQRR
jgi:hypothetical protein